jgi:hypothetical protein
MIFLRAEGGKEVLLPLPKSASGLILYLQGALFDVNGAGLLTRSEMVGIP